MTELLKVDKVYYSRHKKKGGIDSMRVSYYADFQEISEWICVNHEGFAKEKADKWIAERELSNEGKYEIDCHSCHYDRGYIKDNRVYCNECHTMTGSAPIPKDNVESALWKCYREPARIVVEQDGDFKKIGAYIWREEDRPEPEVVELEDEIVF